MQMLHVDDRLIRRCPIRMRGLVWLLACLLLMLPASHDIAWSARKVDQIVTPLGIRVWHVEEQSIPLVALRFGFAGGSTQDPDDRSGLASLMASLVTEGAGDLSGEAFARRMADAGVQMSLSASRDQVHGGLDALTRRIDASAELLRMALVAPRFEVDAIERVRAQRIAELELAASEPRALASDAWYAATFPGHPYARSPLGTIASIRNVRSEDIRALHKRLLGRDNVRVVVVGAIERRAVIELVDRVFGELPAKASLAATPAPMPSRAASPIVVAKELPLATAAFGRPSLPAGHEDYPALQVLNHIIGSGDFDATLMDEIRVKRGLAYAVSVSLTADAAASVMLGGMATKPINMARAVDILRESLQRMAEAGPTADQVENAKLYLAGSQVLDRDSTAKLAAGLLRLWSLGQTPERLENRSERFRAVQLDDVRRLAREQLTWDSFNLVLVGPSPGAK